MHETGDEECLGWPGRLAADARRHGRDVTVYNLGIRRDTSEDIAARWKDEAARRLPEGCDKRLAFSFGTNDCISHGREPQVSLIRALETTKSILQAAATSAPTLMIGPPPVLDDETVDARIRRLSEEQSVLCAGLGVPFIATFAFVSTCDVWRREAMSGDGTHPNRGGYTALAQYIGASPLTSAWLH